MLLNRLLAPLTSNEEVPEGACVGGALVLPENHLKSNNIILILIQNASFTADHRMRSLRLTKV